MASRRLARPDPPPGLVARGLTRLIGWYQVGPPGPGLALPVRPVLLDLRARGGGGPRRPAGLVPGHCAASCAATLGAATGTTPCPRRPLLT